MGRCEVTHSFLLPLQSPERMVIFQTSFSGICSFLITSKAVTAHCFFTDCWSSLHFETNNNALWRVKCNILITLFLKEPSLTHIQKSLMNFLKVLYIRMF